MDRLITTHCLNKNGREKQYELGTSLRTVCADQEIVLKYPVIGALVNNTIKDLDFVLVKSKQIEFIDYTHREGQRIYRRSLQFLLYVAVRQIFPQVKLQIQNGISKGCYCELSGLERKITAADVQQIKEEMQSWMLKDVPFVRQGMPTVEAVNELVKSGLEEKACLFEQTGSLFSHLYHLDTYCNYFYGPHVPSTAYLRTFDIAIYKDGLILQMPNVEDIEKVYPFELQNKLLDVFKEYNKWVDLLGVPNLNDLNDIVDKGLEGEVIKVSEALQEKKVAEIANAITGNERDIKVILVAGPSASGKTTFSKRLSIQLAVNGIRPHLISLDDYFLNREDTPLDEYGNYDFESLGAIDVVHFNKDLTSLLQGKEVELPRFNFILGKQEPSGNKLKLESGHILIVEGIHGMNPGLTPNLNSEHIFKVFLSALTQISHDDQNYISTTDNRLIRRMVRDSKYRGYSAKETINRWPSVRRGEEKNIFPYQEYADIMFNSALVYELAVLKKHAEPLLEAVPESCAEYADASRLLKFFGYFRHIDDAEIPPTSLLREFLGGSSFTY
ncbi:MAG: nucleoside kinase [Mangrovibacterium sp.]